MGLIGRFTMEGANFKVNSSSCRFVNQQLTVTAVGSDFKLHLPGMPFDGATGLAELAERQWNPSSADLNASDTLNEGGHVLLRDVEFVPHVLSVRCIRVPSNEKEATFDFGGV